MSFTRDSTQLDSSAVSAHETQEPASVVFHRTELVHVGFAPALLYFFTLFD